MANGRTSERRARAAEAIDRWKPWERSTGSRTTQGKAQAAQNAYRGGQRPLIRALARALHEQARSVGEVAWSGGRKSAAFMLGLIAAPWRTE